VKVAGNATAACQRVPHPVSKRVAPGLADGQRGAGRMADPHRPALRGEEGRRRQRVRPRLDREAARTPFARTAAAEIEVPKSTARMSGRIAAAHGRERVRDRVSAEPARLKISRGPAPRPGYRTACLLRSPDPIVPCGGAFLLPCRPGASIFSGTLYQRPYGLTSAHCREVMDETTSGWSAKRFHA
jgi:hypothetical protein